MTEPSPAWPRLLAGLASLRWTVAGLLLLTVLTVWGTLYQADHGLYRAQERFYQSWVFFAGGWFPFPGAQLVMLILFINLTAALLYLILTARLQWGMLLTHAGLVLMLAAGGVTFYYGSESYLTLLEDQGSNVTLSHYEWELSAWQDTGDYGVLDVTAIDLRHAPPGATMALSPLGLELEIVERFANSVPRKGNADSAGRRLSASGLTALDEVRPSREPAEDRPGLLFRVRADDGPPVDVLLHGDDGQPTTYDTPDTIYAFMLRKKRLPMPVLIRLLDFQKEMHPGSRIAKSYSSLVSVEDGDFRREVLISMNKPLRYQGLTFYQSSYQELPDGREASTFSVVRNYGRTVPYVATGVTVVGMVVHFLGILVARVNRKPVAVEGAG